MANAAAKTLYTCGMHPQVIQDKPGNCPIDPLRARNLKVLILRRLGDVGAANILLQDTLQLDRLDWWARHLNGQRVGCDLQTQLDVAHDYARAGFLDEAIDLLKGATATPRDLPDQW